MEKDSVKVYFGWEHPRDPEEYVGDDSPPKYGWPSWWSFEEWKTYCALYDLFECTFDQGLFGHSRPKPTCFATSSWWVYERLDQQLLTLEQRKSFGAGPSTMKSRIKRSGSWSLWAPGFASLVLQGWAQWGRELQLWEDVHERQSYLLKLSTKQSLKERIANDHIPWRKGCPTCISSAGRQRQHRRATFPSLWEAHFDVAGPFVPGQDFNPMASGRDKGSNYRYFVACAFTIPHKQKDPPADPEKDVDLSPAEAELDEELAEYAPSKVGVSSLRNHQFEDAIKAVFDTCNTQSDPMVAVIDRRVRGKQPEKFPQEDPPLPPPKESPGVTSGHRSLFLGIPTRSKSGKEVLLAVQLLVSQLLSAGFPVHRFFADRAQELRSKPLVQWLADKSIYPSWTAGEDPASNKAELSTQHLKQTARKLLLSAGLSPDFWPVAIRHASQRHWRVTLEALGIPQLKLFPFGLVVHARLRKPVGADAAWRPRTSQGIYLGEAPQTPGGHLVLLSSASGTDPQRVLLTNTVYPVSKESIPKPKFRMTKKAPLSPDKIRTVTAVVAAVLTPEFPDEESSGGEWVQPSLFFQRPETSESAEGNVPEDLMQLGIQELRWDFEACLEVLEKTRVVFSRPRRSFLAGDRTYVSYGLYVRGGMSGVTLASKDQGALVKYLNGVIRNCSPSLEWTSISLSHNTTAQMHRDLRNDPGSRSWILG